MDGGRAGAGLQTGTAVFNTGLSDVEHFFRGAVIGRHLQLRRCAHQCANAENRQNQHQEQAGNQRRPSFIPNASSFDNTDISASTQKT